MDVSRDPFIEKLLRQSDKAELLEWLQNNIGSAERCFIVIGVPNDTCGLQLHARQVGFSYEFELRGFIPLVIDMFDSYPSEEEGT